MALLRYRLQCVFYPLLPLALTGNSEGFPFNFYLLRPAVYTELCVVHMARLGLRGRGFSLRIMVVRAERCVVHEARYWLHGRRACLLLRMRAVRLVQFGNVPGLQGADSDGVNHSAVAHAWCGRILLAGWLRCGASRWNRWPRF